MRFLCDMGISRKVSQWLRLQGHESAHLGEEGLARLPNGQIFAKAKLENRIVLTFDLDFGEITALAGDSTTSVVVFRVRNTRADHVIDRLSATLAIATQPLEAGAIVTVEETRVRIRELPVRKY